MMPKWRVSCSFAPSSLLFFWGGGWGIIVPFYAVQDCRISENFDSVWVLWLFGEVFLFILLVLQFWVWIISNYTKYKQWKTFLSQTNNTLVDSLSRAQYSILKYSIIRGNNMILHTIGINCSAFNFEKKKQFFQTSNAFPPILPYMLENSFHV